MNEAWPFRASRVFPPFAHGHAGVLAEQAFGVVFVGESAQRRYAGDRHFVFGEENAILTA